MPGIGGYTTVLSQDAQYEYVYTEVISWNDLITDCMWNMDECGNVSVIAHNSYLSTSSYREYTHVRACFRAYVCM